MVDLDKNIENQIKEIVEKYQKEGNKLLNYLITDDKITFFSTINNGKEITTEDLQKVAEVLNGTFDGFEIVNQEYRFNFTMNSQ
jgi:transcriptional regulator of heat shock response